MSLRRTLALCASLHAAVIALAWRPFLDGRRSPFEGDIEFYHHPVTRELMAAWSEGRIPLWTDHVYCGFPFFADPQTAAWYPGTLLIAALGPHHGYVFFLLLHAVLAAVGMLLLVRAHGGSWPAGFAAGLLVPLSGFFSSELQHPGLFAILCWLPLWLCAVRAVFVQPTAARIALGALPLAMMAFAGTLQVLFGAVLLLSFYVGGLALSALGEGDRRGAIAGGAAVVLTQVLGMGLAAVVLLPTFAHFPYTARALGMDYAFASMGSAHPLQLLGLFVAGAASQLAGDLELDFDGASFYVGALTLPLAGVGLLAAKRRLVAALGLALLAIGLLAAGRYGPLHPLLYDWLPGAVGALRGMGRAIGPGVVGLALLAGLGLHRLHEPSARRLLGGLLVAALVVHGIVLGLEPTLGRTLGGALVLAIALVLWFLCRRRPAALRPTLAALVVIDLLWLGAVDDVLDRSPPPPGPEQLAGAFRFPALAEIAQGRFGGEGDRVLLLGFGAGNFTFHHRLDGVGGYNPLVTLQYLDFASLANYARIHPREPINGFVHSIVPGRRQSSLFDAASVRFVISAVPLPWPGMRLLERYGVHPLTQRPVLLYENERALPRAYLAYRTQRSLGPEDLGRGLGPKFDARRESVFEGDAPALEGPPRIEPVQRTRSSPERLSFEVAPDRKALLVVTDAWHPGWRAEVDGVPSPVVRVNAHFRGVSVPLGAHRVEMRFEPWTFRAGAALSLAALVALALLAGPRVFRWARGI